MSHNQPQYSYELSQTQVLFKEVKTKILIGGKMAKFKGYLNSKTTSLHFTIYEFFNGLACCHT